jgi:hypothetical protein
VRRPLQYAKALKEKAKLLGVPAKALDAEVKRHRSKDDEREFLPHWNVEPWPEEVDGDALLDELRNHFRRYVVLPEEADVALALWVLHTWVFECFDITPYLAITSPTPRCGKTVLMTLLYWLCCRTKKTDSMSKAVIYRSVDVDKPTLVLDEVNWVTSLDDERAGIINGGFERNGHVETCEGEGAAIKPRLWSTYCPIAFGLIGRLTPTLMDRSIEITMQRKTSGEFAERLRRRDNDDHAALRQKCRRWAEDNIDALKVAPEMVAADLNDRAVDCWEPLLIIAKQAGGEWLGRALYAAKVLSGDNMRRDDRINVELLADIQKAFGDVGAIRSVDLCKELTTDPERPWVEWRNGKPLTPKQLGYLLRPFNIISETVRLPGLADAKGYLRSRFEDAWRRYLPGQNVTSAASPPFETSKRPNADGTGTSEDFSIRPDAFSDVSKNSNLSHSHAGSDASSAKNPLEADAHKFSPSEETSDDPFGDPDEASAGKPQAEPEPNRAKVATPQIDDLSIPPFLDRRQELDEGKFLPGTLLTEDDVAFLESGKFR